MKFKHSICIWFLVTSFFCLIFILLIIESMFSQIDHDEHQFVASGKLLSSAGYIPYLDYAYFHLPYLVLVYSFVFRHFNYLLLSARLVSVVSSFGILLLIFILCLNNFKFLHYILRIIIAIGFVVILVNNNIFIYVNNLSWNNALSGLYILLSFTILFNGLRRRSEWYLFFAGFLLGIATGIRLSRIVILIPFLIIISCSLLRSKPKVIMFFCLGFVVALLPALCYFVLLKEQFIFGNFIYPLLNTLYRQKMGYTKAMTFYGKIQFILKDILCHSNNFLLVLSSSLFFIAIYLKNKNRKTNNIESLSVFILIPFLLLEPFLISPSQEQYFYLPIIFLLVSLIYSMRDLLRKSKNIVLIYGFFFLIVFFSTYYGIFPISKPLLYFKKIFSLYEWEPIKVHLLGKRIALLIKDGKVLTFAPIYPLEGGVEIYKEFTTGPFAYRIGYLVKHDKRLQYRIVSQDDLEVFLNKEPPKGILLGFEKDLEGPMIKYAEKNGYKKIYLSQDKILWISLRD